MKRVLGALFVLVCLGALATGGVWLWGRRPWRTAVSVNGRVLTAGELELRAQTLCDDAVRTKRLAIARGHEAEAVRSFRKEAAQMWIVKEVLLGEAVARGTTATQSDEKEALAQAATRLKKRDLTVEDFFREGPLPEELKRQDFREGMLIGLFMKKVVGEKVSVTPEEIDQCVTRLKKLAASSSAPALKTDRKTAINTLRTEKYNQGFRRVFRELFVKADVKCPMFPALESVDGVSPPRPEDASSGTAKGRSAP